MFSRYKPLALTSLLVATAFGPCESALAGGGKSKPLQIKPLPISGTTIPGIKPPVVLPPVNNTPKNGTIKPPNIFPAFPNLPNIPKVTLPGSGNGATNPPTSPPPGGGTAPTPPPPPKTPLVLEILRELARLRAIGAGQGGNGTVIVVQPPVQVGPPTTGTPPDVSPPKTNETPPASSDPEKTPPDSAALTVNESDIELLEIRFVDGGDANKGPAFRVRIRNNGKSDVKKAFAVTLTASLGREPTQTSPQASVKVQSIKAGETVNVDVRLPATAMRMGKNIDGKTLPFAWLFALVDAEDVLGDRNPGNNLAVMARGDIAVIDD